MDCPWQWSRVFWPQRRQRPEEQPSRESQSSQESQPLQEPQPVRRQSSVRLRNWEQGFKPTNGLGPHYLNLFHDMYNLYQQIYEIKQDLEQSRRNRFYCQSAIDAIHCDVESIRNDTRMDFTVWIEGWDGEIVQTQAEKAQYDQELATHQATLNLRNSQLSALWEKTYKHFQEYLDRCLEVSFEQPWSIGWELCMDICPVLKKHLYLQERKAELHHLLIESLKARHTESAIDSQRKQRKYSDLEELVKLAQERQEELQRDFITGLEHFLIRAGKIDGHAVSDNLQQQPAFSSPRSSEDRPEDEANDSRESEHAKAVRNATQRYSDARDAYEDIQTRASEEKLEFQNLQYRFLMTFTGTTIASFDRFMAWSLQDLENDLRNAEAEWVAARQHLIDLGEELPDTPERLEHVPSGGGLHAGEEVEAEAALPPSPGSQTRKQRRVNLGRVQTVQDADPAKAATPPSDRSLGRIGDGEDRYSRVSGSATPSSGRKRKLDEYKKEQGRAEEEPVQEEEEPVQKPKRQRGRPAAVEEPVRRSMRQQALAQRQRGGEDSEDEDFV